MNGSTGWDHGVGRPLLGIEGMDRGALERILEVTDRFAEIGRRPIPKVPALRGRTVASVFFEDSTRTRLSFETAARRLSADTLTFTAGSSSLSKGESLRDTVEVIRSLGPTSWSSGTAWPAPLIG